MSETECVFCRIVRGEISVKYATSKAASAITAATQAELGRSVMRGAV